MSAITKAPAIGGSIELRSLADVGQLAKMLANARGFVPKAYIGDANGIAAAVLTGMELGIGPMQALRSIHMIDGRPCMAADFMLARALLAGVKPTWLHTDAKVARVRLERHGQQPLEIAFRIEEAENAGLLGKDNWRRYPAAMLRARCISAALRAYCPDVLGAGIYTPEELGAEVREDGEPIEAHVDEPAAEQPRALPPPEQPKASGNGASLASTRTAEELASWVRARSPQQRERARREGLARDARGGPAGRGAGRRARWRVGRGPSSSRARWCALSSRERRRRRVAW